MADYNGVDVTNRSTGANRHGIPSRGGNPQQCIWPKCPKPIGIYEGTKMCSEHALEVGTLVRRHILSVELIQMKRIKDYFDRARKARKPTNPAKPKVPTIYYLRVGSYIKIGWTNDLAQRMRSYHPDSVLLATEPGTRADEAKVHARFAGHRSHGREWYPLVPVLMEHIKLVADRHGDPPNVPVGAQPVRVPQPRRKQYIGGPAWAPGNKNRVLRG